MNSFTEHFAARQRASIEAAFAVNATLWSGFEKLVDLNLKVVKASTEEWQQSAGQLLSVTDVQDALSLASTPPSPEKALAYSKHVYDIVAEVGTNLAALGDARAAEGQRELTQALDEFSKSAPAGSEGLVSLLKTSFANATQAYDSVTQMTRQAAKVAETNLNAATNAGFKVAADASEATAKATSRVRRAA